MENFQNFIFLNPTLEQLTELLQKIVQLQKIIILDEKGHIQNIALDKSKISIFTDLPCLLAAIQKQDILFFSNLKMMGKGSPALSNAISKTIESSLSVQRRLVTERIKSHMHHIGALATRQHIKRFLLISTLGSTPDLFATSCEKAFQQLGISTVSIKLPPHANTNQRLYFNEKCFELIYSQKITHILCFNQFFSAIFINTKDIPIPVYIWVTNTPVFNCWEGTSIYEDNQIYLIADPSFESDLIEYGVPKNKIRDLQLAYDPDLFCPIDNSTFRYDISHVGTLISARIDLKKILDDFYPQDLVNQILKNITDSIYSLSNHSIRKYIHHIFSELNVSFPLKNPSLISQFYSEIHWELSTIMRLDILSLLNNLPLSYFGKYLISNPDLLNRYPFLKSLHIKPIPHVQLKNIYQQSKINININAFQNKNCMNMRFFEVLGANGFLLSQANPRTLAEFKEDVEFVSAQSPAEFLEKTKYYLKRDDLREAIARSGHQKVLEQHTYYHRMQQFLSITEDTSI